MHQSRNLNIHRRALVIMDTLHETARAVPNPNYCHTLYDSFLPLSCPCEEFLSSSLLSLLPLFPINL
jgi:hypothetical protein